MQSDESSQKKRIRKSESRKSNTIKLNLSKIKESKVKFSVSPRKNMRNKNAKKLGEINNKRKRRSSVVAYTNKINLNLSNIKPENFKFSISPRKKYNNKDKNISTKNDSNFNKINLIEKHKSLKSTGKQRNSSYNPFIYDKIELNKFDSKRYSLELLQTKTTKFYQKYNLNENQENPIKNRNIKDDIRPSQLNVIGNNIKNALSDMITKIEKTQAHKEYLSPKLKRNKMMSSPDLKFIFTKKKKAKNNKKKDLQSSLYIKGTNVLSFSFKKKNKKQRNKSFDYNGSFKKKIIKKIKNKFFKKSNDKLTIIKNPIISSDDDSDLDENYYGFSFFPNSNFIFIFDFILIIANFYTFIVIPLNAARNKNLRERGDMLHEILHYLIDIIYLFDFVICLFKGYYDFEMNIIRNNKKIIIHYLNSFLLIDFLQAIPLFTLFRIYMKPNDNIYLGNSEYENLFIIFLLFIKPLKIFKIVRKRQNKALEDFYSYLSESYYLEKLVKFLIYFLVFFLFIHLAICLHIYFSLQSYPNWIVNTNLLNQTFSSKYIASFYFMITTMTTVGYGDIICISFSERIYHIILLFIGTLLYTFLVSKIGNYLRDESHEQIKLSKDLNILESIRITYPAMPFKLYTKIKNHLMTIFTKRKKTGLSLLINGVPDAIKNDLLFKIYSKVINGFIIFKDVKNSNFVLQMLTSFIPVISKKEEIIILEGEIVQNIVFVKDGRLSMELYIDLNDPLNSIITYIKNNFIGISRQEEIKNYNFFKRVNTAVNKNSDTIKNFNSLKEEIDNFLLDNKEIVNDNSIMDGNGISMDLGRLDFSRNEITQNNNQNLQIIKIIDIRKNEHYGDINILLDQTSPFTLKVRSRIAELLLLRKHDALIMSKNFPNIWRRIHNKSYHNLVSIKKLTFKTLKQYYETHYYKNNSENNLLSNLDVTKKSSISSLDNRPSFLKNLKTLNKSQSLNSFNKSFRNLNISKSINKSSNKTVNKFYYKGSIFEKPKFDLNKTKNYFKRNKLFLGYEKKRKSDADSFGNELNYSLESSNINSLENSQFKFTNSIINNNKHKKDDLPVINIYKEEESFNEIPKNKKTFKSSARKYSIRNENENFTFKNGNESHRLTLFSPKNMIIINRAKSTQSQCKIINEYNINSCNNLVKTFTNSKRGSQGKRSYNSSAKETVKISRNSSKKKTNKNNDVNFITLEDVNANFSKKIKKKIKRRKKLQKLKELLKLQKLKINKNLIELYANSNIIKKANSNDIISNSYSSSNYKINSRILMSSSSSDRDCSSSYLRNVAFNIHSLKIILSDSFEINSSYKNLNILSKGEIIKNEKFGIFLENSINIYLNKCEDENKVAFSLFSPQNKKTKNKDDYFIENREPNKKNNENEFFSEGLLTTISKKKYTNLILEVPNHMSNKKTFLNIKTEKTTDKPVSTGEVNKNSSKLFEKELESFEKIKLSSFKKSDNELKKYSYNIKSNFPESNIVKGNIIRKRLQKSKILNKIQEKLDYKDKKSIKSSFKDLYESDNSKNENKFILINKSDNINNNSSSNIIQINNFEVKKSNNCYIF